MAGAIVRHRTKLYAQGLAGKPIHGGTTISGTMILSQLAGIKIFGTGGLGTLALWQANPGDLSFFTHYYLGGVHRGGENSMDISGRLYVLSPHMRGPCSYLLIFFRKQLI